MNHQPSTTQFEHEIWNRDCPCFIAMIVCAGSLLGAWYRMLTTPTEPGDLIWVTLITGVSLIWFSRNYFAGRTWSSFRVVVQDGVLYLSMRVAVAEDEPSVVNLKDIDKAVLPAHSPIMVELMGESNEAGGIFILETTDQLAQFEELLLEANPDVVIVRE